jgi:hypothetical protein
MTFNGICIPNSDGDAIIKLYKRKGHWREEMSMKKKYKVILIVLAAILVVVGSVLVLKREKKREIVLTDFKYGQEYQFGALDWHTALEEVEDYLKCSLEPVPGMTPLAQSGYAFYRLTDAAYFLNGNSATDRIEFKDDKLSMIQFTLKPENPEALLKEIAVCPYTTKKNKG